MYEELIFQKLWLVLPLWLVLYIGDYCLTIIGARYYRSGVREHIVFERSYELTPALQSDIDALRLFSPKFVRAVIISSALIVFLWYVSSEDIAALFLFKFLIGDLSFEKSQSSSDMPATSRCFGSFTSTRAFQARFNTRSG